MQSLDWYYRRLKAMSVDEILWRVRSSLRDRLDRCLVKRRQVPRKPWSFLDCDGLASDPGFRVCDVPVGAMAEAEKPSEVDKTRYNELLARAEKIAAHQLSFFDLKDKHLGDPIVWNRDHKRQQDTPMTFCPLLDYRDVNEAGDCKFVWEPNRHHQLVVLARAYRASGDVQFARAVAEQLDSWLTQNPFGVGMNWRSGLELGIRLINWVWALDMIAESKAISEELNNRILDSVSRHIWEIDRKYSRGSSKNNHLIGEAAGAFIAASYFQNLKHASRWRRTAKKILHREILDQTCPDGNTKEQAIGYHLFVLQFYVVAGLVARATKSDFPESYWSRLEQMFECQATLSEGGDRLPAFGDGDDGYVLDLGSDPRSSKEWLAVGAALFEKSEFKARAGQCSEPVEWLLGRAGREAYEGIPAMADDPCCSKALSHSGYYLLQHGQCNSLDRISAVFDCGPLGMGSLAAHGHADALSFTLRAFGKDVLVDPGTYDYFSYPQWRQYFRSTRSHNTVAIDGQDQSEMLGLFLWGRRASAQCLDWKPTDDGGTVVGQHDGYAALETPATHRRTLELDGRQRKLTVRDEIITRGTHKVEVFFHLAEHCGVKPEGENRFLVDVGPGTVTIQMDSRLDVQILEASENPIGGWVSRGYHQKQPSNTLVGACTYTDGGPLECIIEVGKAQTTRQAKKRKTKAQSAQ